jgi:hypothetical protein
MGLLGVEVVGEVGVERLQHSSRLVEGFSSHRDRRETGLGRLIRHLINLHSSGSFQYLGPARISCSVGNAAWKEASIKSSGTV